MVVNNDTLTLSIQGTLQEDFLQVLCNGPTKLSPFSSLDSSITNYLGESWIFSTSLP